MSLNIKVKELFHPEEFPVLLPKKDLPGLTLLKVQKPARYIIHIQDFNVDKGVSEQIDQARSAISKRSGALWLFKEVGACIIFTCKQMPDVAQEELVVDKTGFHSVIIQGIHVVSEKREHMYNQSKWFNRSFGKSKDVAKALVNVAI